MARHSIRPGIRSLRFLVFAALMFPAQMVSGSGPEGVPAASSKPTWPRMGDVVGKDGGPMVLVPAGEFLMGSAETDPLVHISEQPQASVRLRGFHIDRFEVTVAQYDEFLADVKVHGHLSCDRSEPESWSHVNATADKTTWASPMRPVTNVGWYDAVAYCAWAGERLPTEEEWEKAARGTDGRIYPWGNEPPGPRLLGNFRDEGSFRYPGTLRRSGEEYVLLLNDKYRGSAPVGSFAAGASPCGAEDMAGNVVEWVATRFDEKFQAVRMGAATRDDAGKIWAVTRGGSFESYPRELRAASRGRAPLRERADDRGFRCVQDLESPQP